METQCHRRISFKNLAITKERKVDSIVGYKSSSRWSMEIGLILIQKVQAGMKKNTLSLDL